MILKALSDETRLKLLERLQEQNLCVGGLARDLGVSESAVSQHLRKLRACGLVTGEKQGYWTHYQVNGEVLRKLAATLEALSHRRIVLEPYCSRKEQGAQCFCPARKTPSGCGQEEAGGEELSRD
jgi:DNA-binding transcriptional ArsR family regulator